MYTQHEHELMGGKALSRKPPENPVMSMRLTTIQKARAKPQGVVGKKYGCKIRSQPIPFILGESKVLGYQYKYEDLTIWIASVLPDPPSVIAGFAKHDYIIAVAGNPIENGTFINEIRDKIISGEIEFAILDLRRDGQKMEYLLKEINSSGEIEEI